MTRKNAEEVLAGLPEKERGTVEALRKAYRELRQILGGAGISRRQWARKAGKRTADVCLYASLIEALEDAAGDSPDDQGSESARTLPTAVTVAIETMSKTFAAELAACAQRAHKMYQDAELRLQDQLSQAKAHAAELNSLAEEMAREVVKVEPLEEALKNATSARDAARAALRDSIAATDLTRANLSEARSNFEVLNNAYRLLERELGQLLNERNFMQSAAERGSGLEVENAGLREKCAALGQEVGRLFDILSRQV